MLTLIYDIETYPNCFTLAAEDADSPLRWCFEISEFRDDTNDLLEWIEWINSGARACERPAGATG